MLINIKQPAEMSETKLRQLMPLIDLIGCFRLRPNGSIWHPLYRTNYGLACLGFYQQRIVEFSYDFINAALGDEGTLEILH